MSVSNCFASFTRSQSLGYVISIIDDDSNIWEYPQTILKYKNQLTGEINATEGLYSIGGNYAVGSGALGIYLKQTSMYISYAPSVEVYGGNIVDTYDQKIDLLFGCSMNDIPLGARVYLYGNSHEIDSSDSNSIQSVTGFGLNLGATFFRNLETQLEYNYVAWTNKYEFSDNLTDSKGYGEIEFGGRYWLKVSNKYTLIPHLKFKTKEEGYKNVWDERIHSSNDFDIGLGCNYQIADHILSVLDVGFKYFNAKLKLSNIQDYVFVDKQPYIRIGLEAEISSWLSFRMGGYKRLVNISIERDRIAKTEKWEYATTHINLGVAFCTGNLEIDATIDPKFLTRGPNFISGTSGNIASRISLTYSFDD